MSSRRRLEVFAVSWPEIRRGADLAALLTGSVQLLDGDVVVLTSKVVSKAEGRVLHAERSRTITAESRRVVAQRGGGVIAETRHGFVLAAAGVDASNTDPGTVVLLPEQPDDSARRLRADIQRITGRNVAVIVTDTAGRAWRLGQTDMAIGCAGILPALDLRGTLDSAGNVLEVTTPAVADELAAAGDVVKGKASGCPVAVARGVHDLVLPVGEHGPGAAALLRDADTDLFALGTREAATAAALRSSPDALRRFPALTSADTAPFAEVVSPDAAVSVSTDSNAGGPDGRTSWLVRVDVQEASGRDQWLLAGRLIERTSVLGAAFRLTGVPTTEQATRRPGWQIVDCTLWSGA